MQAFLESSLRKGAIFQTPSNQSWLIWASYISETHELNVFHQPQAMTSPVFDSWTIVKWSIDETTNKLYAAYSETAYVMVKPADFEQIKLHRIGLERTYLHLTNDTLPAVAKEGQWPVSEHHCFQRILLDDLFQTVWYDALRVGKRPAYKQLNNVQLGKLTWKAWQLSRAEKSEIERLNQQSLAWRRAR